MSWTEFTELDCMKLEIGHQVRGFRGKLNHLQIFDLSLSARYVTDSRQRAGLKWLLTSTGNKGLVNFIQP